MADRLKGNVAVRLVRKDSSWRQQAGWSTTYTYHGLRDDIDAAKNSDFYTAGASSFQAQYASNSASDGYLVVTYAAESKEDAESVDDPTIKEFSNDWMFSENRGQVEPWKLPKYRALETVKAGYIERVIQSVERYKTVVQGGIAADDANKNLEFDLDDYIDPDGDASQIALAKELAGLLVSGQNSSDQERHVLRNIRTVPGNTSNSIDHFKTGQMWSNDKLVSLMSASDAVITQRNIVGDVATAFDGSYWYKSPPITNPLGNGKFEVVTEWTNYVDNEPELTTNTIYS